MPFAVVLQRSYHWKNLQNSTLLGVPDSLFPIGCVVPTARPYITTVSCSNKEAGTTNHRRGTEEKIEEARKKDFQKQHILVYYYFRKRVSLIECGPLILL